MTGFDVYKYVSSQMEQQLLLNDGVASKYLLKCKNCISLEAVCVYAIMNTNALVTFFPCNCKANYGVQFTILN